MVTHFKAWTWNMGSWTPTEHLDHKATLLSKRLCLEFLTGVSFLSPFSSLQLVL